MMDIHIDTRCFSFKSKTAAGSFNTITEEKRYNKKAGIYKSLSRILTIFIILFTPVSLAACHLNNQVENPRAIPSQTSNESHNASLTPEIEIIVSPEVSTEIITQPAEDPAVWKSKFKGKFTDGEIIRTDYSYKSANINVTVKKINEDDITYYLADIYVTDLKYFRTAFGKDSFDVENAQSTRVIAKNNNAIIAINGDFCTYSEGPVLRNGVLYRDKRGKDVMVMYDDGSMETYYKDEFDMKTAQAKGAYQIWTFGPMLLHDGQPMTKFNSNLGGLNPRTAIGYYEPGHYCFVVVDGRQEGYSEGITLKDFSQLFYDLGCKAAFNLDGGQTSEMAFMGEFANKPYHGGRSVSDIIYVADE